MAEESKQRRSPGMAKNIVWNFAGQGAPLAAAVVAVPLIIQGLGIERFGVLTLAWMVIGYFSFFDLGIGRALTKVVAERLGSLRDHENGILIWTGLIMLLGVGILSSTAVGLLTPWLIQRVLSIPPALQEETAAAFHLLALSIPLVVVTAGLRAVLDAHHRFDLANMIRLPLGMWTFLSPLAVLPFSHSLRDVVLILVAGRVADFAAHLWACAHVRPGFFAHPRVRRNAARELIAFGGWITVSNIIGPIILYFDRFLIGALLTMTAVAYYTTPYEVVIRFGLIPNAVVGVLFPAFAATLITQPMRAALTFDRALRGLLIVMLPLCLIISTLAYDGLRLWINESFAHESYRVAQWLCAGLLLNALAKLPYAVVQAAGNARSTALLHFVELPLHMVVLWSLVSGFGIVGAASAWCLRAAFDMVVLLILARKELPALSASVRKGLLLIGVALASLVAGAMLPDLAWRLAFLALTLGIFALLAWKGLLTSEERRYALRWRLFASP